MAEGYGLKRQLRDWRWLLLFVVAAQLTALVVPAFVAVTAPVDLLEGPAAWTAGPGARLRLTESRLDLRGADGQGGQRIFATRTVPVADGAEMLLLRTCLRPDDSARRGGGAEGALLLASLRDGALDFNRSYELQLPAGRDGNRCTSEPFPRRRGDGPALLQLQPGIADPAHPAAPRPGEAATPRGLSVTVLEVTPLRESATWRWLRRGMLLIGIALVARRFYRYVPSRSRLFSVPGLLAALGSGAVAAIVFGCLVSVPLKAEIYELMTGGRAMTAPGAAIDELLVRAFPRGGFSIFTLLHAVLFAVAGTALGLAGRRAVPDLLLLGIVTETLQLFVPGRGPGVDDLLVDWSGVAAGVALVFLLRRPERVRLFLQEQGIHEDVARL